MFWKFFRKKKKTLDWNDLIKMGKKSYGMKKFEWVSNVRFSGECDHRAATIRLNTNIQGVTEYKVSVLFHEFGHLHCFRNGIWKTVHPDKFFYELTSEDKRLYIKNGLNAEQWIDRWAAKEMAKHYPYMKYHAGYDYPEVIEDYNRVFLAKFREDPKAIPVEEYNRF